MESGKGSNNKYKNENISTVTGAEQITVFKSKVWFADDNKNN